MDEHSLTRKIQNDMLGLGMQVQAPPQLAAEPQLLTPSVLIDIAWKVPRMVVTKARVDAVLAPAVLRFRWFLSQNPGLLQTKGPRAQIPLDNGKHYSLYMRRLVWMSHTLGPDTVLRLSHQEIYNESIRIPRILYKDRDVFNNTFANLKGTAFDRKALDNYEQIQQRLRETAASTTQLPSLDPADMSELEETTRAPLDTRDILGAAFDEETQQ